MRFVNKIAGRKVSFIIFTVFFSFTGTVPAKISICLSAQNINLGDSCKGILLNVWAEIDFYRDAQAYDYKIFVSSQLHAAQSCI